MEMATKNGDIDYIVGHWGQFLKEYEALVDYVKMEMKK